MNPSWKQASWLLVASIVLGACAPEAPPAHSESAPEAAASATEQASSNETRVREASGAGWGFRAEWPAAVEAYRPLAESLHGRIEAALAEISTHALPEKDEPPRGPDAALDDRDPVPPVETQMNWRLAAETPTYVALALEGYTYTGGAHGMPLHDTLHYAADRGRLLDPAELMSDERGWLALSSLVREALYRRLDESLAEGPADAIDDQREWAREWIDRGTEPEPSNLGLFVPHTNADGKVETLTFIFPPYQVGPYAEGTHGIDVPLGDLAEHLSPSWRAALLGQPR